MTRIPNFGTFRALQPKFARSEPEIQVFLHPISQVFP